MTGMFASDDLDVAALVAEHLGPRVLGVTLHKPSGAATRDPDNPTLVNEAGSFANYPARGWIEDFSLPSVDDVLIKIGDRKVTILGGTLPVGIEPEGGPDKDQITVEHVRWSIQRVLSRDPAGATYILQVRAL